MYDYAEASIPDFARTNEHGVPAHTSYKTLSEVVREVDRARKNFPTNKHNLAALTEELGEVAKAFLDKESPRRIREEAMQVACVAIRIMEEGDADFGYSVVDWNREVNQQDG